MQTVIAVSFYSMVCFFDSELSIILVMLEVLFLVGLQTEMLTVIT